MGTEVKSGGTFEVKENMLSDVPVSSSGVCHKSTEDPNCTGNIGATIDKEVDERADQCLILVITRLTLPIITKENLYVYPMGTRVDAGVHLDVNRASMCTVESYL
jgi:hypothetical protein